MWINDFQKWNKRDITYFFFFLCNLLFTKSYNAYHISQNNKHKLQQIFKSLLSYHVGYKFKYLCPLVNHELILLLNRRKEFKTMFCFWFFRKISHLCISIPLDTIVMLSKLNQRFFESAGKFETMHSTPATDSAVLHVD